jgi:prepilin-type N-terminal cleavage/methylation domain-containing protein/prepilin-type processing-associated H-X9-DG protein
MSNRILKGFTLAELVVVIAIVCVLAAILYPVFAQERARAGAVTCVSNLQYLSLALGQYSADNDGALIKEYYGFPPEVSGSPNWGAVNTGTNVAYYGWRYSIQQYIPNNSVLACPQDPIATNPAFYTDCVSLGNNTVENWVPGGYATNQDVIGFANGPDVGLSSGLSFGSDIADPANTIIIDDSDNVWLDERINWIAGTVGSGPGIPAGSDFQGGLTPCGTTGAISNGYSGSCAYANGGSFQIHQFDTNNLVNFIFADGHVKSMNLGATAIPNDLWDSGESLSQRTTIVQNMLPEYQ